MATTYTESGNNTASTSWGVTFPSANVGDLIIVNLAWDDSTNVTSITPPTGPNGEIFTNIQGPQASNGTANRGQCWYTVATGSWSAGNLTFTPNASEQWTATVIKVSAGEFDATTPIGASNYLASTTTGNPSLPSLTAGSTDGGGTVVGFISSDTDDADGTVSGWTTRVSTDRGAIGINIITRDTTATNSESISSASGWTFPSARSWVSFIYIIRQVTNTPPIVTLNSPNDTATTSDTTPDLIFTGTDDDDDEIRYQVQISKSPFGDFTEDNFDSINTSYWNNWGGANVTSSNNQLRIQSGITQYSYHGLETLSTINLTSKRVFIQVIDAGTQDSIFELYPIQIEQNASNSVYWFIQNGYATCWKVVNGTYTQIGSSRIHTNGDWYQIRESGGTTYWEYSSNGIDWSVQSSQSNPITLTSVIILVFVGVNSNTTAHVALLDNYNLPDLIVNVISGTDSGFSGSPDNTDPFASGQEVTYTVQAGDELISNNTYYWRVRGKDPSGSNIWGAWSSIRSFTITSGSTTQTQTVSSKIRILSTGIVKTVSSKLRILQTAIQKTVSAKIRILKINTQTVSSKIRILSTGTTKTISSKLRILNTYTTTISSKLRILIANINKTVQSKLRILKHQPATVSSKIRILSTGVIYTISSKLRILNIYISTIQAKLRILLNVENTISAKIRILTTGSIKTITSKLRILKTENKTIQTKLRILKNIEIAISSKLRIIGTSDKNVSAKLYVLSTGNNKSVSAKIDIKKTADQQITSKLRILIVGLKTIESKLRILKIVTQAISAKLRIKKLEEKTVSSKLRILSTGTIKTISFLIRIKKTVNKTITSRIRIIKGITNTISSKIWILTIINKTISSKLRIIKNVNRTVTSKIRILSTGEIKNISSKIWILVINTNTISALISIRKIYTKNISAKIKIRTPYTLNLNQLYKSDSQFVGKLKTIITKKSILNGFIKRMYKVR